MKTISTRILKPVIFPLVFITLWEIVTREAKNPFFPTPLKIFATTKSVFTGDWILNSLLVSVYTIIAGYLLGVLLGVFLGSVLGSQEQLREVFIPITNFIRSIPSAAKAPLIFALFGIGLTSRVVTVAIAVFFPVLLTTLRAVAQTDQHLLDTASLLKYSRLRTLVRVKLPAATGEILAGLQVAMQIAVLVMVVSEMLGSGRGVGAYVIRAQSTYMINDMWVGIIALGIIGAVLSGLFRVVERKLAPWYFLSKGIK